MAKDSNDILIMRYLKGEASAEEKRALEQWLVESEENQTYFVEKQEAFQASRTKAPDVVEKSTTRQRTQSSEVKKSSMNWLPLLAVASLLLLLGLGYFFYPTMSGNSTGKSKIEILTYGTKVKETKVVTLPDGSKVKLNHASYLSMKKDFNQKERRIIFEGEGFFEIVPNREKPFVIETGKVHTNVLGTTFNLKAYTNDEFLRLYVQEGKVKFGNPWVHQVETFIAGQGGIYNRTLAELKPAKMEAASEMAWKSNKLSFDDTPIREALNTIERSYDVDFEGKDKLGAGNRITATFENASLEEILAKLAKINYLQFDQEGAIIRVSQ